MTLLIVSPPCFSKHISIFWPFKSKKLNRLVPGFFESLRGQGNLGEDLEDFTLPVTVVEKVRAPAFLQGALLPKQSRASANVAYNRYVAFDIDENFTFDEGVALVTALGLRAAIFTTFSHQMQKKDSAPCDRYRIVFELTEPFSFRWPSTYGVGPQTLWKKLYVSVGQSFGLPFDGACCDPARLFYWHSCSPDMTEKARSIFIDGSPLDAAPFIADAVNEMKADEETRRVIPRQACTVVQQAPTRIANTALTDVREALSFIPPQRYEVWLRIIFAVHASFAGTDLEDEAIEMLNQWSALDSVKYDGDDGHIRDIWRNADKRGGVTISTLFALAMDNGYSKEEAIKRKFENKIAEIVKALGLLK